LLRTDRTAQRRRERREHVDARTQQREFFESAKRPMKSTFFARIASSNLVSRAR
jgi:hypothetical protein